MNSSRLYDAAVRLAKKVYPDYPEEIIRQIATELDSISGAIIESKGPDGRNTLIESCLKQYGLEATGVREPSLWSPVPIPIPTTMPALGRGVLGSVFLLVGGLAVFANSIAVLLSNQFWNLSVSIFFWLPFIDPSANHLFAFAIGATVGLGMIAGAFLMLLGYGTVASIIVFPLCVLSLVVGGGFLAGFVLGIIGAILWLVGS